MPGGSADRYLLESTMSTQLLEIILDNFWTLFDGKVSQHQQILPNYIEERSQPLLTEQAGTAATKIPKGLRVSYLSTHSRNSSGTSYTLESDGRETPELTSHPSPTPSQNILIAKMVEETVGKMLFGKALSKLSHQSPPPLLVAKYILLTHVAA